MEKLNQEDKDHYGCDDGVEMSQGQSGRRIASVREWKFTCLNSQYYAKDEAARLIVGCTKLLEG